MASRLVSGLKEEKKKTKDNEQGRNSRRDMKKLRSRLFRFGYHCVKEALGNIDFLVVRIENMKNER